MRALASTLVVLTLAVAAARADDADDGRAFAAAAARLAAGDAAGARQGFEALVAASPTGAWADDALAEAAAIAEAAGDRAGARALWTRLLREHGASRLARRAQARLEALTTAGGVDGAFDAVAAEIDRQLARAAVAEDPSAALTAVGQALDGAPAYPPWSRAALALGEAWARIGARGLARTWLERARARAASPDDRFRAELALARLSADGGDLDGAIARLRALDAPDPVSAAARAEALADLGRRRARRGVTRLAWAALAVLAAAAAVILWRRRGARRPGAWLWPPPVEVLYQTPVALGLIAVAHSGNSLAASAVMRLSLGGLAITWLAAAVARALARPPVWARGLFVVAIAVAVVAWVWLVLDDDALLDLLIETWRSGHD